MDTHHLSLCSDTWFSIQSRPALGKLPEQLCIIYLRSWKAESNKKISWGFFSLRALNDTLGIKSYPWLLLIVSLRSESHIHSSFPKWSPIRWSPCFKYPKWDTETVLPEWWHSLLQLELWSDMRSGDVSGQKCLQSGLKKRKIFFLLLLKASVPPLTE